MIERVDKRNYLYHALNTMTPMSLSEKYKHVYVTEINQERVLYLLLKLKKKIKQRSIFDPIYHFRTLLG